jgi:carboxyl-terminal processing protease
VAIVENPHAERVLTVAKDGDMIGTPIVILVDGGSASASEILAATLRENAQATLVGEQTYGKGTVQALIPIGTQSLLRLTVARWLTPTGASVTGVGLKPNLDVPMSTDDAMRGNDIQYAAALDLLRKLVQK